MKKKIFLSLFALMFSLFFFTVNANAASPNVLTYEFATNNTRLHSTNHAWNDGLFYYYEETGTDLRPYVSDFTSKVTLNIVTSSEIHVVFQNPNSVTYGHDVFYGDLVYNSVNLFTYGTVAKVYNHVTYYGNSNYGDAAHKNGSNVQPFFLFINGVGTAYAPSFVGSYNSNYNYAAFNINIPKNQNFKIGISFTTAYFEYIERSPEDYYWQIGSSNIVLSDYLYLNY